jgi:hypothetical protein
MSSTDPDGDAAADPAARDYDYAELGLVAGLEIHQQLDTTSKLFCDCPTERRDPKASIRSFTRYLHPTKSELGELDEAAVEESRVDREFEYLAFDSTCLVEEDDEPPHRLDREALAVTLEIAELLDMDVVDRAHVMRKIVVDGSNTSGFQRSTLVATDGEIETSDGPVSITDMLLEEESAARIEATDEGVRWGLDRLGIPLVEIGTGPDIRSPEQAREAAERIGMVLRSTGQVKRGLGTIRQDVNVSIARGARIEMKGVQALDEIEDLVRMEAHRQVRLLEIADELADREASVGDPREVTDVFADTESGVIASASTVMAVPLYGFDGLVGREIEHHRAGRPARIRFKLNNLVDEATIDALYAASTAGVPVDLLVRAICSLRPGVPGMSDNIRVRSVLGRFLEHSRIYAFDNAGEPEFWIGSADLMHRNLDRRVEALVRLDRPEQHAMLDDMFDLAFSEDTASWHLHHDGRWQRVHTSPDGEPLTDMHHALIERTQSRRG